MLAVNDKKFVDLWAFIRKKFCMWIGITKKDVNFEVNLNVSQSTVRGMTQTSDFIIAYFSDFQISVITYLSDFGVFFDLQMLISLIFHKMAIFSVICLHRSNILILIYQFHQCAGAVS